MMDSVALISLFVYIAIDQFFMWKRRQIERQPAGVPMPQEHYVAVPTGIGKPLQVWRSDSAELTASMFSGCRLARAYHRSDAPGPAGSVEWLKGFAEFIVSVAEEQQHSDFLKECVMKPLPPMEPAITDPPAGRPKVRRFHRSNRNPRKPDAMRDLVDEYIRTLDKQQGGDDDGA